MSPEFVVGAVLWGLFALGQVLLPGHAFNPAWFALDVLMCAFFVAGGIAARRRRQRP